MSKANYIYSLTDSHTIIGAISGDIIGSVFEFNNYKDTDFELFSSSTDFTDDSVLTIAVADAILFNKNFAHNIKDFGRRYPARGYGGRFAGWLRSASSQPYNSWGNGSAMRVSAVGFAYESMSEVLEYAKQSAEVTHNHPEGIKGAQATAAAIFMARKGKTKQEIKEYIVQKFGYNLNRTIDEIRPKYKFNESCQETVPEAIIAFLESNDYESAIRTGISLGGDSDTIACITGGIAAAYYKKIPKQIIENVIDILPEEFLEIILLFDKKFA